MLRVVEPGFQVKRQTIGTLRGGMQRRERQRDGAAKVSTAEDCTAKGIAAEVNAAKINEYIV